MILKELRIDSWVGDVTNCYIVQDEKSKETMVIDPAGDVDKIVEMLDILNANLKYIYLTHCHGDHIGGVKELKEVRTKILDNYVYVKAIMDESVWDYLRTTAGVATVIAPGGHPGVTSEEDIKKMKILCGQ